MALRDCHKCSRTNSWHRGSGGQIPSIRRKEGLTCSYLAVIFLLHVLKTSHNINSFLVTTCRDGYCYYSYFTCEESEGQKW